MKSNILNDEINWMLKAIRNTATAFYNYTHNITTLYWKKSEKKVKAVRALTTVYKCIELSYVGYWDLNFVTVRNPHYTHFTVRCVWRVYYTHTSTGFTGILFNLCGKLNWSVRIFVVLCGSEAHRMYCVSIDATVLLNGRIQSKFSVWPYAMR